MNLLIIFLCLFGAFFFLFLPTLGVWLYFLTFNKQAIIANEVGEDENDALIRYVKCKVAHDNKIGFLIKFHPFSGLKPSKYFDSKYWTTIKMKNKLKEGIALYRQGENYRPMMMENGEGDNYNLVIQDEDNRKFRMMYEIAESKRSRDGGDARWAIIGFFIFVMFVTFIYVTGVIWVMDDNTKTYFVQQGWSIIAG